MFRLLIFARESELIYGLIKELTRNGHVCTLISDNKDFPPHKSAELLLLEVENGLSDPAISGIAQRLKGEWRIPVILLADRESLPYIEDGCNYDDFILKPYDVDELSFRIKRVLESGISRVEPEEHLKAGDIVIDLPRCEVYVAGKPVDLTFTEYELLKLLMSKKGHVLSRETLLNKIWGYDYFGGDRTVDVHITRLRSKIEDPSHNIIETVRNIGYRIKEDDK